MEGPQSAVHLTAQVCAWGRGGEEHEWSRGGRRFGARGVMEPRARRVCGMTTEFREKTMTTDGGPAAGGIAMRTGV